MASCSITTQNLLRVPGVQEQISQRVIRVLEKDGQHQPHECILDSIINSKREEAFYVLDLDVVTTLYDKWTSSLPMIQPFYAVKCNPDKALLGALAALGSNFDCASQAEIESVLSLGVSPTRIIYANPCKADSHLKFAASVGVNLTTFDSREELDKIKMWHPKCSLLIRIKVPDDGKAIMPLSSKFGALPMEVLPLLEAAKAMKLNVIGVSFHVGSAVTDAGAYLEAIAETKRVFDMAVQLGMPKLRVLDIGGGFIAGPIFDQVTTNVKAALEAHFTNELQSGLNLSVISEPGRFFAETPFTLAATIIGKRVRGEVREYWINDGTFGSFICVMFDALSAPIKCMPLACTSNSKNVTCQGLKTYSSQVFGPTLDSCDVVLRGYQLPELEVNDWLVFPNMGAYTACLGSSFNGFNTPTVSTYLVTSNNN